MGGVTPTDPRPASAFDAEMYGPTMPHKGCPDRHVTHPPHSLHLGGLPVAYCEGLADPMAQFPMGDVRPKCGAPAAECPAHGQHPHGGMVCLDCPACVRQEVKS